MLKAVINTHSNADHTGGNRYLQQTYGCPVFSSGIEAALSRYPVLEPAFLYGGFPPEELRHKFFLAEASDAKETADPAFPAELRVVDLPGHFFGHIGVKSPDGTVYIGDSVSGAAVLEKYRITFIYDVAAYLDTLSALENMEADLFVPAHAAAAADIKPLVELNRKQIFEIAERITAFCGSEPAGFETLLQKLFDFYGLSLNFEQYALAGSTVKSYLSWLKSRGTVTAEFAGNRLLWRAVRPFSA
jgi:glyoxylase-like metal-dependent hydrolase (beta-lactamase superfamily II)